MGYRWILPEAFLRDLYEGEGLVDACTTGTAIRRTRILATDIHTP